MTKRQYDLSMLLVVAFIAAIIAAIAVTGESLIGIAASILTVFVYFAIRQKFKSDVIEDERIYRLRDKSSRIAVIVFVLAAALPALLLVMAGKNGNHNFLTIGYTLLACISFLLIADLTAYYIMNRKHME